MILKLEKAKKIKKKHQNYFGENGKVSIFALTKTKEKKFFKNADVV